MTFEIFRRMTFRGRRFFWHLRARNQEIVCSGQSSGFANKGDVLRVIDKIAKLEKAEIKFLD